MARIRILFYGINGTGLGHLSRLLHIAREARELLEAMNVQADFRFITTSEASQIAWDFPVYKLPSKTVVANSGTANHEFLGSSQFFVSNLVASMRPDILVMDTVPEGSFGEFLSIKSFCRRTVFINRHKKEEVALNDIHQKYLPLYDLILIPDHPESKHRYHLPIAVTGQEIYTEPIHGFRTDKAFDRDTVRKKFGVSESGKLAYVSAGGGGDKQAEEDLENIIQAVTEKDHKVLVGYGPLYSGEIRYDNNIIPCCEPEISRYFKGLDYAISAAGYNTFQELLAAKVPTAFYAQEKGLDLQYERIVEGKKQGWNLNIKELTPTSISLTIEELTQAENTQKIRKELSVRKNAYGAYNAAEQLLKLHCTIPGSPVNYEQLPLLSAMKREWSTFAQSKKIAPTESNEVFGKVAACQYLCQSIFPPRQKQLVFEHLMSGDSSLPQKVQQWLEVGLELTTWQTKVLCSTGKLKAILNRYFGFNPPKNGDISLTELINFLQEEEEKIAIEQLNK